MNDVVIVGAGHGGVQTAASLRDEGFGGRITLIDAQPHRPYHRPPLSKAFMKGEATAESLALRGDEFYAQRKIDFLPGERVLAIDRAARRLSLRRGGTIAYGHLVLATGAQARPLPFADGFENIRVLRTFDDAAALRERLSAAKRVAVIGAGFIGLEFAAVAASLGHETTILDIAPRVMGRAVSPPISEAFAQKHRALGSTLLLGVAIEGIEGAASRAAGLRLRDGARVEADLFVAGVGVLAEDFLAREAGLSLDNGVLVDEHLLTSDENISAVGDNNAHPNRFFGGRLRLESVQNALDQGRCVARRLAGKPEPYAAVPWFWSDQADYKLQIAGVAPAIDDHVTRGDPASGRFSVFGISRGLVATVESVNRPADHMAARKILADAPLTRDEARDESYDLKAHVQRAVRRAPA